MNSLKKEENDVGWNAPPTSVTRKVIAQVSFSSSLYDQGVNSLQPREDDVDQKARGFIKRDRLTIKSP
jgi:hypothetical protein